MSQHRHSPLRQSVRRGLVTCLVWLCAGGLLGQEIPTAHWPLDEGAGTVAGDAGGTWPGQVDGALWVGGKLDGALDFDGVDDRIAFSGPGLSGSAATIALWLKADDFDIGDGRLISRASGTNAADHDWMLSTVLDGGVMRLRARFRTNGTTATLIATSGEILAGTWTHAALVYDGTLLKLFQDGVEVGSTALSGTIDERMGLGVSVGNQPAGAGDKPFDGIIDDIRVYDVALDAAGLAAIMDPCDGLPLAAFDVTTDGVTVPVTVNLDANGSSDCDGTIQSAAWDFGDGQNNSGFIANHVYPTPGSYDIVLTVTDNDGQTASTTRTVLVLGEDQLAGENLLAAWDFTDAGGSVVNDTSGIAPALDLTIQDPDAISWDPCGGLEVAGDTLITSVANATKINDAIRAGNALTIEAWLVPGSADQSGPARIATLSADGNNRNLTLGQEGDEWVVRLRTTDTGLNGTNPVTRTDTDAAAGLLTHVVYTRDAEGAAAIYVDGTLAATQTVTGDTSNWTDYSFALANELTGDRPWLGTFHRVAIYDTALDAAVIAHHRAVGPPATCNRPPVARIEADVVSGSAPLAVSFDATRSSDPDGTIADYSWDFGDGQVGNGPTPQHVFTTGGVHRVTLTVTDDGGETATRTLAVEVSEPGAPHRKADGLLALYRFDEGSGDRILDQAGNGEPLDLTLADELSSSWLSCSGLSLDSASIAVSNGPPTDLIARLQAGNALTIEAWVKPDDLTLGPDSPARIVTLSGSTTVRNFALGQKAGELDVRLRTDTNNGAQPSTTTSSSATTTDLLHVVYTRDAFGAATLYVNNTVRGQETIAGDFSTWDESFVLALGNETDGSDRAWLGDYHLVALYDRALSAAEIDDHYAVGLRELCLALAVNQPADGSLTNADEIVVTGTVSHPGAVVTVNGVAADSIGSDWSATLPLVADGSFPIEVSAEMGGRIETQSLSIVRDTEGPAITLDAPAEISQLENLEYSWTADDANGVASVLVTLNGNPVDNRLVGTGSYAVPEDPSLTEIVLVVTAQDTLGNESTKTETVTVYPPCTGTPTAAFDLLANGDTAPLAVLLDAARARDCDGTLIAYAWDLGDGNTASGTVVNHTYTEPGSYLIALTVTDDQDKIDTATVALDILPRPSRATDHLLAEYRFDEGSGTLVADVSGVLPALDLEIGDPAAASWAACGGLRLDSPTAITAQNLPTELIDAIRTSGALTLEAWLTPANTTQNGPARVVSISNGAYLRNLTLGQEGSTWVVRLRTTTAGDNGLNSITQGGAVHTELTHVLFTRDAAGNAALWVDGTQVATQTVGGDLSNWADDFSFVLGNETTADRPWLGTFHQVALYDAVLTPDQIATHFSLGEPTTCNRPPVASLQADRLSGEAPLAVTFDGLGSYDPDGAIARFSWSFGDSSAGEGLRVTHTYADPGLYTATLTVVDDGGLTDTRTVEIHVTAPGTPQRSDEDLAAYYSFRDGSGDHVPDRAGLADPLDLTIADVDMVTWQACGGLRFDDDTIALSAAPPSRITNAVKTDGALTIEAWVEPTNLTQGPTSPARMVTISDTPHTRNVTLGQKAGEYDVRFRTTDAGDNGANPSTTTTGNTVTTTLNHVVFVREPSGLSRIYVNDVIAAEQTVSGDAGNWDDSFLFALGNEINPMERAWLGTYYLVAVYTRALSETEVADHYAVPPVTLCPNLPPVFTSEPVTSVEIGAEYAYPANAVDPDGDTVSYSLLEAPDGMTVDTATGAISWSPGLNEGDHAVEILAVDGRGGAAIQVYTLTVTVPELIVSITDPVDGLLTAQTTVTVSGSVSTPLATLTINGINTPLVGNSFSAEVTLGSEGDNLIEAVATLLGREASDQTTVVRDTTGPTLNLIATPNPVDQGTILSYVWSASDPHGPVTATLILDGTIVSSEAAGNETLDVPFDPARAGYAFSLEAADSLGNTERADVTVTVIPIAFSVSITDPVADSWTTADNLTVSGTVAHSQATVLVNGSAATVAGNAWTVDLALTGEGPIALTAEASLGLYAAGDAITISRDVTPPVAIVTAPERVTMGQTLSWSWTVTDNLELALVDVTKDGTTVSDQATGTRNDSVPIVVGLTEIALAAYGEDRAGNTHSDSRTVIVDPIPLAVAIAGPTTGSRTAAAEITVTGTVTNPAAAVTVNGVAAIATDTDWTATVPLTVEGPITLTATATFGAQTADDAVTIVRDVTGPVLGITVAASVVQGNVLDYAWTADDESGIASVSLTRNGVEVAAGAPGSDSFTVPYDAALTEVSLVLTAGDTLGNSNTRTETVSVLPPDVQIAITSPVDLLRTAGGTVTVSGTVTPEAAEVTVNGGPAAKTGSTWTVDLPLTVDGEIPITATATLAGVTDTAAITIIRDITGPALTLNAPESVRQGETLAYDWAAVDDAGIASVAMTRDGVLIAETTPGSDSLTVPYDAALTAYTLTLTATDTLGNNAGKEEIVTVLPPNLVVAITSPTAGFTTSAGTVTVSGTVDPPVATVTVAGLTTTRDGANWSAGVPLTLEGANPITAEANLAAATAGDSITVIRDQTPPVMSLNALPSPVTMGETLTITWSATDDSTPVTGSVTVNGIPFSDQAVGEQGYTVPIEAGLTQLDIVFDAQDDLGNADQRTLTVPVEPLIVTIAITAPADGTRTDQLSAVITGTVSEPTAMVTVNSLPATLTGTDWEATVPLDIEGDNPITATATLTGAQPSEASITIMRDTTPPVMSLSATPDPVTMGQEITITWSATDDSTPVTGSVAINGTLLSEEASGEQGYTVPIEAGLTQLDIVFDAQD
nr:PKD domain-containing protein [Acidobacteriota bacterium]